MSARRLKKYDAMLAADEALVAREATVDNLVDLRFGLAREAAVPVEAQGAVLFLDLRNLDGIAIIEAIFHPDAGALNKMAPPFVAFWIAVCPLKTPFRRVK